MSQSGIKQKKNALTSAEKAKAVIKKDDKQAIRKIARDLGKGYSTVRSFLQKVETNKAFDNQNSKKGPYKRGETKLTGRQQELLQRWIDDEEVGSSHQAWLRLSNIKNEPQVSYNTVNTYLKSIGDWKLPTKKIVIRPINLTKRVDYCKKHKDFDFKRVIFTDESQFTVNYCTLKVFCKKGDPNPSFPKQSSNYSVMVWGGVSHWGQTSLSTITGWLKHEGYIDLLEERRAEIKKMFRGTGKFYFLQDNAPPHRPDEVIFVFFIFFLKYLQG